MTPERFERWVLSSERHQDIVLAAVIVVWGGVFAAAGYALGRRR